MSCVKPFKDAGMFVTLQKPTDILIDICIYFSYDKHLV